MTAVSDTLRGWVEAVYCSTPKFCAGRLRTAAGESVSFAGALTVQPHDALVLQGAWERHPKFGRQFKVAKFSFDTQLGPEGLAHYLASHPSVKGIGPAKAKRIAEAFGKDFDRIIEEDPERVAKVAKLSRASIEALREQWLSRRTLNTTFTWLASFELTHRQMSALVEKYGPSAVAVLKKDPYLLLREVPGFGFRRIDEIAAKMGISSDHPSRVRAAIIHCVAERLEQGDCWITSDFLLELATELLGAHALPSNVLLEQHLEALLAERLLSCMVLGARRLVALPHIHQMEKDLAELFASRLQHNAHFGGVSDAAILSEAGDRLNTAQQAALLAAARHNLLLVSGGAGSGKTFTVSAIHRLYQGRRLRVVLAAPTGKAAKRMEQVVGVEAVTLHRLLGFNGQEFGAGPDALIEADVIIVDEVSMVDVPLAWHLFRSIDLSRTALVLVGDHNQLPPVGPGNLLRDIIERRPFPTAILDQVVRQAGVLKENSIAILRGEVRKSADAGEGGRPPWVVVDRLDDVEAAQAYVLQLFDTTLVERLKFDLLANVQLLTPTKKGPLGVDALNLELQRLVQRRLWGVTVAPVQEGRRPEFLLHDRVIQTRNNYELGVMNGAIGIVTAVGRRRGELTVRFDGEEVQFTPDGQSTKNLSLAYALTIHKAQGSEFPCVVLVIHKTHAYMHHRNLFYTGVTRAQQVAIVIGDADGMRQCAAKQQVERRKTFLSVLDLSPATRQVEHSRLRSQLKAPLNHEPRRDP